MLQLGLNLPFVEGSMDGRTPRWADILGMAEAAEAVGFDAVWVSDHVGFGDPDGDWRGAWESWTLLAALAASTRRVALGTYVLAAPFRNPALVAKMAETLDEVSGGRVTLGIGAGWNEVEFTSYGVPFDERFASFEDALRIITAMLRRGVSTHDGRTFRTRSARLEPRGHRPGGLPVMVGAAGPRMLRLTAELADHWNGGLRTLDEVPGLLEALDAACQDMGRDPSSLTKSVEVLVRTSAAGAESPAEERAIRGGPAVIAAELRRFGDLGIEPPAGPATPEFDRWRQGVRARHRGAARRRVRDLAGVRSPSGGEVVDRDLDHRRVGGHRVRVHAVPGVRGDPIRDGTPLRDVRDDAGRRGQIRLGDPVEMEREVRVRLQVDEPGTLAVSPGRAGDDQPAVHVVEDDLDPARLAGPASRSRDVDAVAFGEAPADLVVHGWLLGR